MKRLYTLIYGFAPTKERAIIVVTDEIHKRNNAIRAIASFAFLQKRRDGASQRQCAFRVGVAYKLRGWFLPRRDILLIAVLSTSTWQLRQSVGRDVESRKYHWVTRLLPLIIRQFLSTDFYISKIFIYFHKSQRFASCNFYIWICL